MSSASNLIVYDPNRDTKYDLVRRNVGLDEEIKNTVTVWENGVPYHYTGEVKSLFMDNKAQTLFGKVVLSKSRDEVEPKKTFLEIIVDKLKFWEKDEEPHFGIEYIDNNKWKIFVSDELDFHKYRQLRDEEIPYKSSIKTFIDRRKIDISPSIVKDIFKPIDQKVKELYFQIQGYLNQR
ncbi:hypothetical protein ACFL1H_00330 [Nanoarchaeota archaeon]